MTKLIDAALLNERLAALARAKGSIDYNISFTEEEIMELIDSMPKSDAVMAVHCNECKRMDPETGVCAWWDIHVRDMKNYCQMAEKKSEEIDG